MSRLKEYLLALGVPGLFAIAALDSAGVPMAGGPDAVLMFLSWQRPSLAPVVALTAALGSTLGCLFLYKLGRKGGEMALTRFSTERRAWVETKIRENDLFAVMLAVLGPPPFPTKLFILAAGVVAMPVRRFVIAVFVGRFVRYSGEAYLGARFGDRAAEILKTQYPTIGVVLALIAVGFLTTRYLRQRRESPTGS